MEFQALNWFFRDEDDTVTEETKLYFYIFGRTARGSSICVKTPYKPYFFLEKLCPDPIPDVDLEFEETTELSRTIKGYPPRAINFTKLTVKNLRDYNKLKNKLKYAETFYKSGKNKFRLYESNLAPNYRILHDIGCASTSWLSVPLRFYTNSTSTTGNTTEMEVDGITDITVLDKHDVAPLRIASYDIETYSSTGLFPDAEIEEDIIIQIALTQDTYGDPVESRRRMCLSMGPVEEGETIRSFSSERDLLLAFRDLVVEWDPDFIMGWNVFGFDNDYIMKRARMNKVEREFGLIGKVVGEVSRIRELTLSSSALGDNTMATLPMPGRFSFDLMAMVKREKNYESYSLNYVSHTLLGVGKDDVTPAEMFAAYSAGDIVQMTRVANYCLKDTELPLDILKKLCMVPNLIEMAKATLTHFTCLSERGQGIKVYSLLVDKARKMGYKIPEMLPQERKSNEDYQGATVLNANAGAYYEPITVLDAQSLYPSCILAENMCFSTLIPMGAPTPPGVEVAEFFPLGPGRPVRFVQDVEAVLPSILRELKEFRLKAKRDMAEAKGTPMYEVYNGKQLAMKLVMNSTYGFCGANQGYFPEKLIASSITYSGRKNLEVARDTTLANFPSSQCVYGDSVTPDTPILIRVDGEIRTSRIDALVENYRIRDDGKEVAEIDAEVWTERGFTPIRQIVRHRTTKNIHRVVTHTGVVDVTEDHSLLLEDASMIKPTEVTLGTRLLHGNCVDAFLNTRDCDVSVDEAKVMGFFFGEEKIVPPCILNAPIDVVRSFCDGYHMSDGDKDLTMDIEGKEGSMGMYVLGRRLGYNVSINTRTDKPSVFRQTWTTSSQRKCPVAIKKLEHIGTTDGYVYDLTTESHHFHVGPGELVVHNTDSIMIRFDCSHLATQEEKIAYAWEQGERASSLINSKLRSPHNFELEKVYCPYMLYSKKRYGAKLWEKERDGKMRYQYTDVKGLQLVRRDQCQFVRETCSELLTKIMDSDRVEPAIQFLRERAVALVSGEIPLEKLIESRNLSDDGFRTKHGPDNLEAYREENVDRVRCGKKELRVYNERSLPHVKVRDKMWRRSPGSEPHSGERVRFLTVQTDDRGAKACDKAEDVEYVRTHNIPIDYRYYLSNRLRNPSTQLLEPLLEEGQDVFEGILVKATWPTTVEESATVQDLEHLPSKVLREYLESRRIRPVGASSFKKDDWINEVRNCLGWNFAKEKVTQRTIMDFFTR